MYIKQICNKILSAIASYLYIMEHANTIYKLFLLNNTIKHFYKKDSVKKVIYHLDASWD